ncbi:MAG: hypothetical protein WDM76_14365 [Limisphaerales bacterium]
MTALRFGVFHYAHEFIANAIEDGDKFAMFQTEDMKRVMRLASIEPERFAARNVRAADRNGA